MTFHKKKILRKKNLLFLPHHLEHEIAAPFSLEELLERQFILRKSEKKDPEERFRRKIQKKDPKERFCSPNQKGNFFPIAYTLRVLVVS
jgi:hypothetical protein